MLNDNFMTKVNRLLADIQTRAPASSMHHTHSGSCIKTRRKMLLQSVDEEPTLSASEQDDSVRNLSAAVALYNSGESNSQQIGCASYVISSLFFGIHTSFYAYARLYACLHVRVYACVMCKFMCVYMIVSVYLHMLAYVCLRLYSFMF